MAVGFRLGSDHNQITIRSHECLRYLLSTNTNEHDFNAIHQVVESIQIASLSSSIYKMKSKMGVMVACPAPTWLGDGMGYQPELFEMEISIYPSFYPHPPRKTILFSCRASRYRPKEFWDGKTVESKRTRRIGVRYGEVH